MCHLTTDFISTQISVVLLQVSPVTRKPVFGVCDQLRLKPACSATETSYGLEMLDLAIILSKQWATKALISLREYKCTLEEDC